jgi:ubiquinone biosynthesis protein
MSIFSIARTYRNLRRMKDIVQVLSRYGFGHLVVRMNLLSHIPLVSRIGRIPELPEGLTPQEDLAFRTRLVLEELGPTFIKLGQVLSERPDLLGDEFRIQFRKLQDHVAPFEGAKAKETVSRALGQPTEEIFSSFDSEPMASGSIGQAHAAVLKDGTGVVVKVKRPGIESKIRDDINVLRILAELAEQYIPEVRILRPGMVVDEFAHRLDKELDFVTEAAYTSRFADLAERVPAVRIPRVFWQYTSRDVLCIERLQGVSIGDTDRLRSMGIDLKPLATVLADAFLTQFFKTGLFHADPHPGNILVSEDGTLGLIDFGMVSHLTDEVRGHIGTLIFAVLRRDVDLMVEVYREMGVFSDAAEVRDLKPDIQEMLDRYFGVPLGKIDAATIFQDIIQLGRKHQGFLPRDFVMLGKALVIVGNLTKRLDPEFDIVGAARPYTMDLLKEKVSPGRLSNIAVGTGWTLTNLLKRLPSDVSTLLRKAKSGTLKGVIEHEGFDAFREEVERASNRLTLGLILASLLVGSALMTASGVGPKLAWDIPVMGVVGFTFSAFAALLFVLAVLRSGRI